MASSDEDDLDLNDLDASIDEDALDVEGFTLQFLYFIVFTFIHYSICCTVYYD